FTAVARMKKFLAKVESADSVHTLPAAQPDWHTVELAMTRGLLGRCRVSLYNVMANFISVAEKTPSTPLPGATEGTAGVDRAIVHIQKNVGTPLVIDVRCKNLSGQLTITPKIPIERVQPFIAPLKLQLQKALDNCASQRKKLGTKKLLLDRRLPQAQFLWEKHRILTKMLLDLIILENQLKRQSGGEVSLTTVKKEFMLVAIAHSYHARALYFMVRSDFYRQYGRYRPAALKNANMEAYRLSKDPRMQAYYRRYKKQFERLQAANRSYMAARHSVEELGKVQMYYKRFNTFSEPLLSPKDAPGQTTKSF
ncbi:hypothetical protein KJ865_00120, partial [Myxococcota bacterium]|nr:hypothetical protein [Myxococcota bacterium]